MPLANIDNGPNICVKEHAVALVDLLLSFENLTGLVFGLGQDPSARPLFEDSLISALRVGKLETSVFSTVTRLDIEDTALFWTAVCPSVQDLTLRLGYSSDGAKLDLWPVVESIRSLRVSGTAHCAQSSQVRYGWFGIERRGHACGSGKCCLVLARRTNTEMLALQRSPKHHPTQLLSTYWTAQVTSRCDY